mmetsp:Transcript_38341/g.62111  ORF Transcript_38341/g.62111 Transcript_38341/m.62111 type:complete len:409 (-) Transcript_38341:26-1252(-)
MDHMFYADVSEKTDNSHRVVEPPIEVQPQKEVNMYAGKQNESHEHKLRHSNSKLFGIEIGGLSTRLQFIICTLAVFIVYQGYAYLQEYIVKERSFAQSWFCTLTIFGEGFVLSTIERAREGDFKSAKAPWYWYFAIGALHLSTIGFSNLSLNYVNYPTQVMFKSSKVIPVMLVGIVILGKRYHPFEYLAAFCFMLGLAMFTLAGVQTTPNFNVLGVICLGLALSADAFIGNAQEKLLKRFAVANTELVQWSYACALLLCMSICIVNGELVLGIQRCMAESDLFLGLLVFAFCGYIGVNVVLVLVNQFGAVTSVVVTSCRKLLTIFLSFILFPKPFTSLYAWATLSLFAGMLLQAYAKNPREIKALFARVLKPWRYASYKSAPSSDQPPSNGHALLFPDEKKPEEVEKV